MSENAELASARVEVDQIDNEILELLNKRKQVVGHIAVIKAQNGIPTYQPERYRQMLGSLQEKAAELGLDPGMVEPIWSTIHEDSLQQQGMNSPSML